MGFIYKKIGRKLKIIFEFNEKLTRYKLNIFDGAFKIVYTSAAMCVLHIFENTNVSHKHI